MIYRIINNFIFLFLILCWAHFVWQHIFHKLFWTSHICQMVEKDSCFHVMLDEWSVKTSYRYDNNIIQKLWTYLFICQQWHFFINPVWKQMCCNCWTGTGDQSIYFSHVYWETTYKLRLYLSYNSSQVWPTRISGVIESVFRCSGPNSKSIVTLTRPM